MFGGVEEVEIEEKEEDEKKELVIFSCEDEIEKLWMFGFMM